MDQIRKLDESNAAREGIQNTAAQVTTQCTKYGALSSTVLRKDSQELLELVNSTIQEKQEELLHVVY